MSLQVWMPLLGNLDNQGLDSQSQITGSNLSADNNGKIGACYKMGPSNNSCITLSQDAVRSFAECSVAMWVKINSWNTAYCTLFECGLASSVSWRYNSYIWCRNNTASSIVFSISDGTNYTGTNCSFGTLSTGVWYHLCGTYTSGKMCTYVNGNLVQEYSTAVIPNFSSVIRTMIGACKTDTYQTDCYYNDIRIYDHALSPKEAKEISKGLFMHYKLTDSYAYDCSGFKYDAIRHNITYSVDSPRYDTSSVFNGTNSYIKVDTNTWMVQGAEAMTINVWAKGSSWANAHVFSCTETGGFNTESSAISGYLRFIVHAYTNADKTSSAYVYDGYEIKISDLSTTDWNMLTFVYDTTGTKTYINGELHHTYAKTSYGMHFNTNARLFLGCEAATANPYTPYFSGQESDFRIYATALSDEDIKELYQTSARIDNHQNLISYEFVEDSSFTNPSVTKNGLVRSNNLEETTKVSLYDNGKLESNTFIES